VKLNKNSSSKTFSIRKQSLTEKCILHLKPLIIYRRKKIGVKDFEPLNIIGRGAFGEVRICRFKESGEVVAMKKMKKSEMLYKN
jgi:serine/threonine kinase 38